MTNGFYCSDLPKASVCASTTTGEICGCSSPHGSGLLLTMSLKMCHACLQTPPGIISFRIQGQCARNEEEMIKLMKGKINYRSTSGATLDMLALLKG